MILRNMLRKFVINLKQESIGFKTIRKINCSKIIIKNKFSPIIIKL